LAHHGCWPHRIRRRVKRSSLAPRTAFLCTWSRLRMSRSGMRSAWPRS
jgi:hypothetical protein